MGMLVPIRDRVETLYTCLYMLIKLHPYVEDLYKFSRNFRFSTLWLNSKETVFQQFGLNQIFIDIAKMFESLQTK